MASRGTGASGSTGRLLASGRTADVYEIDEAWVLRRDRQGWGDAAAEGAVMEHVRAHGCPVPRLRPSGSRTELVLERLHGPTMLRACLDGALGAEEAGALLARLLRTVHAVPALHSADPAARVLHLDLHPENVILTADGPRIIDWGNAEDGDPALDWGMSAVILAQAAVDDHGPAAPARAMLTALLAGPAGLTPDGLAEARRRRACQPTMSRRETELLGEAEELVRSVAVG
ncbi:phosphotransferase [Streptomyces sp. Li-HN-5-11]|uniref:phosphotransferase n=1 Tax=Streptomyces sp. Li-HN-5-11 TaxID=3075432 RepID=UPI0028A84C31|nr:phosphotransferase [Streptomyces sp. Li-HN-5-11]WNM34822.1 phosphotransferase [Streptomyces sp. Li-HN-5-11]